MSLLDLMKLSDNLDDDGVIPEEEMEETLDNIDDRQN